MDLILIAAEATPPVAKIADFNKFLYEQDKKAQQSKANSRKSDLKEFRFGPSIDEGDIKTRIRRSEEFLRRGDKVKITIRMKGRENAYPEIAMKKIEMVRKELEAVARIESAPERKGSQISATFIKK